MSSWRVIILKADRSLFGHIIVVAHKGAVSIWRRCLEQILWYQVLFAEDVRSITEDIQQSLQEEGGDVKWEGDDLESRQIVHLNNYYDSTLHVV